MPGPVGAGGHVGRARRHRSMPVCRASCGCLPCSWLGTPCVIDRTIAKLFARLARPGKCSHRETPGAARSQLAGSFPGSLRRPRGWGRAYRSGSALLSEKSAGPIVLPGGTCRSFAPACPEPRVGRSSSSPVYPTWINSRRINPVVVSMDPGSGAWDGPSLKTIVVNGSQWPYTAPPFSIVTQFARKVPANVAEGPAVRIRITSDSGDFQAGEPFQDVLQVVFGIYRTPACSRQSRLSDLHFAATGTGFRRSKISRNRPRGENLRGRVAGQGQGSPARR